MLLILTAPHPTQYSHVSQKVNPLFFPVKDEPSVWVSHFFLRLSGHYHGVWTIFLIKMEVHFRGCSLKEHLYHFEGFYSWVSMVSGGSIAQKWQHRNNRRDAIVCFLDCLCRRDFKLEEFKRTTEQMIWQNLPKSSSLSFLSLLTVDHVFRRY